MANDLHRGVRPSGRWLGWLVAGLLSVGLAACGGGGSGDPVPPPPPPVNRAPVAVVGAAQTVTVGNNTVLDGSASSDADSDPLRYAWRLDAAPAGSNAVLNNAASAMPVFTPDRAGNYVWTLVVSDGQADSAPASTTVVANAVPDPGPLSIVLDQPEPVEGIVTFTLSGPYDGNVSWSIDLIPLGPVEGRPLAMMSWDSAIGPMGTHQIIARLHDGQGGWREIRRSFEVGPAPIRMSSRAFGTSGEIIVEITASSTLGMQQVSATLDGQDLGTLFSPNGCGAISVNFCGVPNGAGWRYTLSAAAIGPGPHTMVITAIDKGGRVAAISQSVPVGPVLTVNGLQDSDVVFGTLQLSGEVVGAPTADVEVTVSLNALPIGVSRGPVFDVSYDLAGVPPNRYVVTVRAVQAGGLATELKYRIAIAPSARWVQPSSLLITGQLLAARGTQALVSEAVPYSSQRLLLRDLVSGASTLLLDTGTDWSKFTGWTLGGGRVYATGNAGDCVGRTCLYQWDADGRRSNLTRDNPYSGGNSNFLDDGFPVVQGDHVLFLSSDSGALASWRRLVLFNAADRSYVKVADSAEVLLGYGQSGDLSVREGVARVVYGGYTFAPAPTRWALHEWRSDTQATALLAEGDGSILNVRTDGSRVFWLQTSPSTNSRNDLIAMPLGGGPVSVLAPLINASAFAVQEDGSLTWGESLHTGGVTYTLPPAPPPPSGISYDRTMFGGGLGWLFYVQRSNNTLYAWNAATGVAEPMFDANANKGYVTDGHLVFQYLGAVYRLPLR